MESTQERDMHMKRYTLLTSILIISCSLVFAQEYNAPESAAYDVATSSYFISNFGDGLLFRIDSTGAKTVFDSSMTHALGMVIQNNTLYIVSNPQGVKGFDLSNGQTVLDVHMDDAQFLNDLTCAGEKLYVTDSQQGVIFEIDIPSGSHSLFVTTDPADPNGILYDQQNDRLIVCHFREEAPITAVSLKDKSITTLVNPALDNLDGLTMDGDGNIYVSSWKKGSFSAGFSNQGTIYKYDPDFKNDPEIFISGLKGPADIYYNIAKDEMIIPVFLTNQVIFQPGEK